MSVKECGVSVVATAITVPTPELFKQYRIRKDEAVRKLLDTGRTMVLNLLREHRCPMCSRKAYYRGKMFCLGHYDFRRSQKHPKVDYPKKGRRWSASLWCYKCRLKIDINDDGTFETEPMES